MNFLVEDWGGKYQSQDISAKKGIGVEELLEKVLLEAEMLDLKANPNRKATGSIIESSLDKGRGYVATVLVSNGTLRVGDIVLAGTNYGRVKAMFNERNQRVKEIGPAQAATILGLNGAPTAGDTFHVMDTEQEAREITNKREQLQREQGLRTQKILTLDEVGRRIALGGRSLERFFDQVVHGKDSRECDSQRRGTDFRERRGSGCGFRGHYHRFPGASFGFGSQNGRTARCRHSPLFNHL